MNPKTEVITSGEKETENWAGEFARTLSPGAVIALSGNLGAGKTVLSRGIQRSRRGRRVALGGAKAQQNVDRTVVIAAATGHHTFVHDAARRQKQRGQRNQ